MQKVLGLSVLALLMGTGALTARADLVHRYDFSTDSTAAVSDTVGTANGTLLNGAAASGGALVTNGNNGGVNGQWGGSGPMMTLDPSAVSGITGPFTIEDWFSCTTGWPKFDTLYAFSDATQNNYLLAAPVRNYNGSIWPSGIGLVGADGLPRTTSNWDYIIYGPYLDANVPHQTILTYDGATFHYYVDGAPASYAGLPDSLDDAGFNLSTLTSIGVNGGSPYPDPSLTGSTADFRIYNGALSADQVATLYSLGSDASNSDIAAAAAAVPEPASLALLAVGALTLTSRRRRA